MIKRVSLLFAFLLGPTLWAQTPQEESEPALNRILFVMDASNSMYGQLEAGRTKMQVAQLLMGKLLDSLSQVPDPNFELALRVYGHQKPVPPQDCNDTRLEVAFAPDNIQRIKSRIRSLRPMGTTPIAKSLRQAANDFTRCPNNRCRDIIVLITDGQEECGGDPCQEALYLQKRGITLKPFVIGVGLTTDLAEAFECVGTYYDATDAASFKRALDVIVNQVLDPTTAQVNLLDQYDQPSETNIPVVIRDITDEKVVEAFIHTMNYKGNPDTLDLDPQRTYYGTVYSIPSVALDTQEVYSGKHNHLGAKLPQGQLKLSMPGLKSVQTPPVAIIRHVGSSEILHVQNFNTSMRYLAGEYEIDVLTLPRYTERVTIVPNSTKQLTFPTAGNVTLQLRSASYGAIFKHENGEWIWVTNIYEQATRQRFNLQPGDYRIVIRSRQAQQTSYSKTKSFTVKSGVSTLVRF